VQARFLPHASLFIGFAVATLAEWPVGAARRSGPTASAARRPSLAVIFAGAAVLALAFWPTRAAWRARDDAAVALDRARSTLEFHAREKPPTSHFDRPNRAPEYGVLAEWSYGHFIQFHGRRPAITDNFGDHAGDPTKPRAVFLETDGERALAALDSLRARYVLVGDLAGTFGGMIPDPAITARFVEATSPDTGDRAQIRFSAAIVPTVLYRLARLSGSGAPDAGGRFVPPLAHLRLVAESEETETLPGGGAAPWATLYERVPSARLVVRGLAPGQGGALLATIRSPRGRRIPYAVPLVADSAGTMNAAFPYPTRPGARGFAESCAIDLGGDAPIVIEVGEDDVRAGRTIEVAPR
jgi:hypothetical protein